MARLVQLLAFIILLGVVWIGYEFILFFMSSDKEIKAALIGLFAVTGAAMVSHYFSQKRETDSRQFPLKVAAYENIFDTIFALQRSLREGEPMTDEALMEHAIRMKRDMMIWAGPDVLKAWRDFELGASNSGEANSFKHMDNVFRALRKELGHKDFSLNQGDLVKWLVIPEDHHQVDEQINR